MTAPIFDLVLTIVPATDALQRRTVEPPAPGQVCAYCGPGVCRTYADEPPIELVEQIVHRLREWR